MYGQHHAANKTCTVMQNSHSQGECKQITGQGNSKINATNRELTGNRKVLTPNKSQCSSNQTGYKTKYQGAQHDSTLRPVQQRRCGATDMCTVCASCLSQQTRQGKINAGWSLQTAK